MQNTLNRHLINPDIGFVGWRQSASPNKKPLTRQHLFDRINQIKHLFLIRGAKKGDFVCMMNYAADINGICTMFAAAELGLIQYATDQSVWEHKDSDGNFTRERWMGERADWMHDLEHPLIDPSRPDFRPSDMMSPMSPVLRKGDLHGGLGWEVHLTGPIARKEFCVVLNFDEYDQMPKDDIEPWEVNEDDPAFFYGYKTEDMYTVSHKQFVEKARDCIDIFGYRDKKVAMTKSQLHHFSFELNILPSLMSAYRVFEVPLIYHNVPNPSAVEIEIMQKTKDFSLKLLVKNGVELVWGTEPYQIDEFEKIEKLKDIKFIRYEGNDYMNFDIRPKCL